MVDTFISMADVNWIKDTCIIQGNFKLKSGLEVSSYFDVHRALNELGTRDKLMMIMSQVLVDANRNGATILAGIESSGAAVAAFLAARHGLDFFLVRKEGRNHGTESLVEAPRGNGQSVVLIDDVTRDGSTSVKAIQKLRACNYNVEAVVAVAYRGMGAEVRLQNEGVRLWAAVFEPDTPTGG